LEVKYELNKLIIDEFGRPSGILLLDKATGKTAHDVVYDVRRKLKFGKVGHAGALDTFSTGLMIILVGKATQLSDKLMGMEKVYKAEMVLGIATKTQDTEGEISNVDFIKKPDEDEIKKAIFSFNGGYEQFVSPFSSVKVSGRKLRKVLRDKRYSYKLTSTNKDERFIELYSRDSGEIIQKISIPKRFVEIKDINIESIKTAPVEKLPYSKESIKKIPTKKFVLIVKFIVRCSKGTYIRQLAEDIGDKLGVPASLINLRRTQIGEYDEKMILDLEKLIL